MKSPPEGYLDSEENELETDSVRLFIAVDPGHAELEPQRLPNPVIVGDHRVGDHRDLNFTRPFCDVPKIGDARKARGARNLLVAEAELAKTVTSGVINWPTLHHRFVEHLNAVAPAPAS